MMGNNMKKLLGIAGIATAFGVLANVNAEAGTPFHTVTLSATVPTGCTVTGNPAVQSGPFTVNGPSASTFAVAIVGTSANLTTGDLSLGNISCTSSQMRITLTPSGAIKPASGAGQITYSAYLKDAAGLLNQGVAILTNVNNTNTGSLDYTGNTLSLGLRITTNAATGLSAGNYSATLGISVDPL
jgi:hypothetical protein